MSQDRQDVKLPRVAITFCTQCKWMLRAAYFGQELLSTFGTSIGEIALIPATGGVFTVHLTYSPPSTEASKELQTEQVLIWDRKTDGGFPEAKILKQRVRNHIEPDKNLGHSDTRSTKANVSASQEGEAAVKVSASGEQSSIAQSSSATQDARECEDCV